MGANNTGLLALVETTRQGIERMVTRMAVTIGPTTLPPFNPALIEKRRGYAVIAAPDVVDALMKDEQFKPLQQPSPTPAFTGSFKGMLVFEDVDMREGCYQTVLLTVARRRFPTPTNHPQGWGGSSNPFPPPHPSPLLPPKRSAVLPPSLVWLTCKYCGDKSAPSPTGKCTGCQEYRTQGDPT